MKKMLIAVIGVTMMSLGVLGVAVRPVLAGQCAGVNTSVINCDAGNENGEAVNELLVTVAKVMMGLVVVLAVVGVIISGYQYMMSSGDAAKMSKAKQRIIEIVIGLVVFALMWIGLEFLIPGF